MLGASALPGRRLGLGPGLLQAAHGIMLHRLERVGLPRRRGGVSFLGEAQKERRFGVRTGSAPAAGPSSTPPTEGRPAA